MNQVDFPGHSIVQLLRSFFPRFPEQKMTSRGEVATALGLNMLDPQDYRRFYNRVASLKRQGLVRLTQTHQSRAAVSIGLTDDGVNALEQAGGLPSAQPESSLKNSDELTNLADALEKAMRVYPRLTFELEIENRHTT